MSAVKEVHLMYMLCKSIHMVSYWHAIHADEVMKLLIPWRYKLNLEPTNLVIFKATRHNILQHLRTTVAPAFSKLTP
jgi:hypothetical protein